MYCMEPIKEPLNCGHFIHHYCIVQSGQQELRLLQEYGAHDPPCTECNQEGKAETEGSYMERPSFFIPIQCH